MYGTGSGRGWTTSEDKLRSAENDLRNNAAAIGGNYVAIDIGGADATGMTVSGRAFHCDESTASQYAPIRKLAPAPSSSAAAAPTVEERLAKLKDLLDRGIITQTEYDSRRAEILKSL